MVRKTAIPASHYKLALTANFATINHAVTYNLDGGHNAGMTLGSVCPFWYILFATDKAVVQ